jgi:hypothetical protein
MQDIKLIRNSERDANAERGAHFHPTIGSVIPTGFTTSHPQARPRCFETQSPTSSSTKVKDEGYSSSPLLMTLYIFQSSSSSPSSIPVARALLCPLLSTLLFYARLRVARISLSMVRPESFYGWAVHPPLHPSFTLEEPPHLPSWWVIHSRVRE